MVERREVEGAKPATLRYTTALQDGSSWKLLALIVGLVATSLFLLIVTVRISMKYVDVSRGLKNKTKDWIQLDSSHCVKTCDKEAELQKDNFNLKIELNSIKERLASCSKKDGDASITAPVVPPQSGDCPNGWTRFKQKCLFFTTEHSRWEVGRDDCKQRNSTLLILKQDYTNDLKTIQTIVDNWYWVGLRRLGPGAWQWLDGSPGAVTQMEGSCARLTHGVLHGAPCVNAYKWICERNLPAKYF
ncbi:C-type lectin domain family 12 member B-like isoform 1-T1 [Discoglossus pictus]